MRKALLATGKAAISGGLLLVVLQAVDVTELASSMGQANPMLLAVGLVSHGIGLVISAARWHLLMRIQAVDVPFRDTVLIYWVGVFFNAFLPSTVGGDVVKGYLVARRRGRPIEVATTVIAERLVGVLALLAVAAIGFLWLSTRADGLFSWPALGSIATVALLGRTPGPARLGFAAPLASAARSARRYVDRWPELTRVFGLSLVLQANVIVYYFVVAQALGVQVSLAHLCLLIPPVLVLTMLPVSLGGLGVREAAFVALFAPLGLEPARLVAFSLWSYILGLLTSLGGGIVYALSLTGAPCAQVSRGQGCPTMPGREEP